MLTVTVELGFVTVVSAVTVWQLHSAQGTEMTQSDYQWVLKDGFW